MSARLRRVLLVLLAPESCLLCGAPGPMACRACLAGARAVPLPPPHQLDRCTVLLDYHLARPLVTSLKNGQRRSLVQPLAEALASIAAPPPGAVVTWAPTTADRARARGFDQAELLARGLARRWGRPVRSLLRRASGTAQAGRGGVARREAPSFRSAGTAPASVVLVDDVVTTGATLSAAARTLRAAGAAHVEAVAVAHAERVPRLATRPI